MTNPNSPIPPEQEFDLHRVESKGPVPSQVASSGLQVDPRDGTATDTCHTDSLDESSLGRRDGKPVVIACAADNKYAMPLSVTLLTAAKHLESSRRLQVYLLDGGLTKDNRARLEESLKHEPIDLIWTQPDHERVSNLVTSHHISSVAYYRILLPNVLPDSVDRVLYLDSDLLILDDVSKIADLPFEDWWCMAIADIACPYVDAQRAMPNFRRACPYLASWKPIANYEDFGISKDQKYFNSGVLNINIAQWRERNLTTKMLDCLQQHERFVWCWDQYALNATLAGQWRELPLSWNYGTHAFEYPNEHHVPMDTDEFVQHSTSPSIVHFTTEFKPWHFGIEHPYREHFFRYLDQTAWQGWRPQRPPFKLRRWWDRRAVAIQKQFTISYRKLIARRIAEPATSS